MWNYYVFYCHVIIQFLHEVGILTGLFGKPQTSLSNPITTTEYSKQHSHPTTPCTQSIGQAMCCFWQIRFTDKNAKHVNWTFHWHPYQQPFCWSKKMSSSRSILFVLLKLFLFHTKTLVSTFVVLFVSPTQLYFFHTKKRTCINND